MKRIVILLISLLVLVSGCSVYELSNTSTSKNIDRVLSSETKLYNVNFEGYKYYVPRGLTFINKEDYNALLRDRNDNKYYFYIDAVSYYHKIKNKYKLNDDAYYSKKLNYDNKTGYIEINKVNNKYFIECVFNYSKVEVLTEKNNLEYSVIKALTLVKSVKYNDKILDSIIGENVLSYKEEDFNIFNSKSKGNDFLNYVKEYDNTNKSKKDEETIDINEED